MGPNLSGRFRKLDYNYGRSFGTQVNRSIKESGRSAEVVGWRGFTVYVRVEKKALHTSIHKYHSCTMEINDTPRTSFYYTQQSL